MDSKIGEAGQCKTNHATYLLNLESLLDIDLPDCAKVDLIYHGGGLGLVAQSSSTTTEGNVSTTERTVMTIGRDGSCYWQKDAFVTTDSRAQGGGLVFEHRPSYTLFQCDPSNPIATTPEKVAMAAKIVDEH